MRPFGFFLLVALFSLPIAPLSAEIYQFIDAAGTIHFTNVPTDPRYRPVNPGQTRPIMPEKADPAAIEGLIDQAAKAQRISPALIKAIIRAESNFKIRAVSSAGAQGLMQLMPETAEDLKLSDPFDPEENIQGGTRYLRYLLDRFNQDTRLAIAAYHAGPGNVSRHGGVPSGPKTVGYLKRVLRFYTFYLNEIEQAAILKKTEAKGTILISNRKALSNQKLFARSQAIDSIVQD